MQEETSFCPSFSSYSSDKLADIAVKVGQEFKNESEESQNDAVEFNNNNNNDEEKEFEFVSVSANPDLSSTDEFQIRTVFPIFNRDLLLDYNYHDPDDVAPIRLPLKKLFIEDRESVSSSSSTSSEAEDELEGIEPGTYCVWTPKQTAQSSSSSSSNRRCEKSNSTGSSSKRWRFRDLLKRSHSDGKDSFMFLNPEKNEKESSSKEKIKGGGGHEVNVKAAKKVSSAHEAFYVRNKVTKDGDKRKSYLPYRQDLVGLFSSNFNGFGRTFPPFS